MKGIWLGAIGGGAIYLAMAATVYGAGNRIIPLIIKYTAGIS